MKPDGMLVEPEHVTRALQDVTTRGCDETNAEFAKTEPALAAFISQQSVVIAGKLALAGAPPELVQGMHNDILALVLTSIHALRRGHFELWKDAITGPVLAQLQAQFHPPPQSDDDERSESEPIDH
jgi:hypothetical protein